MKQIESLWKVKKELNPILLTVAVITLVMFITSFTIFYAEENFSAVCGCQLPIWVILISITSFGIFSGSLIYFLLNKSFSKEKSNLYEGAYSTLKFLDEAERKVFKFLINNSGEVHQSKISKELGFSKVKTSRLLSNLEKKELIEKEKQGMTNLISMDSQLEKVFLNK